jgi:ribosomal protein S18 acetylase RimI-like enzyme
LSKLSLDYQIRKATKEDLPGLEWEGEYRRFRRLYQQSFKDAENGRRILLVIEAEGKLIGQLFIQLASIPADPERIPGTGYLYSFRVRPLYRNQGLGTTLVQQAEAILVELGFTRVLIGVAQENEGARRLYERLGYQVIANDPGTWSFKDDQDQIQIFSEPTYIMEKLLSPVRLQ